MALRHVPRAYLLFAPLTMFGPLLAFWAGGSPVHPSPAGAAVFLLLLVGLARGSRVAWTLLLAWNGMMFLFVAALGVSTLSGAVLLPVHLTSLVLLLRPSMRHHLDGRPARAAYPA